MTFASFETKDLPSGHEGFHIARTSQWIWLLTWERLEGDLENDREGDPGEDLGEDFENVLEGSLGGEDGLGDGLGDGLEEDLGEDPGEGHICPEGRLTLEKQGCNQNQATACRYLPARSTWGRAVSRE